MRLTKPFLKILIQNYGTYKTKWPCGFTDHSQGGGPGNMRPFSLLVLLMAIALVLGEENSAKKQDENEDEGEGELPKQERGKSINCSYIFDTKEKSRYDVHKSKYISQKKN